jgi:magnesium-transporting ATPase (P-type)
VDAVALRAVVVVNVALGTVTEYRSEKMITSLSKISMPPAEVTSGTFVYSLETGYFEKIAEAENIGPIVLRFG